MPASETPLISLRGAGFTYRTGKLQVHALKDVSLDIHSGEFVAIIGQSGSGKTTLMNLIGCLSRPTSGEYLFEGIPILGLDANGLARLRRNALGFVFQNYNLLDSASARENVQIPAIYAGVKRSKRQHRANQLLSELALGHRLGHLPSEMSGGEQQRVAMARALMNGGRVILADEPTGALDSKTSKEIIDRFESLAAQGHTVIVVTHNAEVAERAQRRIELLDGRVVADSGRTGQTRPSRVQSQMIDQSTGAPVSLSPAAAGQAFLSALRSLGAHKFRTALTLLGIIIGVLSVIVMLALGEGAKAFITERLGNLGANTIEVRRDWSFNLGSASVREPPVLYYEDALAISEKIPNVAGVIPTKSGRLMSRHGGFTHSGQVVGTTPDVMRIKNLKLVEGTFFDQTHFEKLSPVAVIGAEVRRRLFPNDEAAIGAHILMQDAPFRVIGVLAPNSASMLSFGWEDYSTYVPLTAARTRLFGDQTIDSMQVTVMELAQIPAMIESIRTLLFARHGKDGFTVADAGELMETQLEVISTVSMVLGGIAAISLLVAGIGVMNIMLVSVTQRTREIGIRMAAGARNGDVLMQFLLEAVLVCVVGGIVAIILAGVTANVLAGFDIPFKVTGEPILMSLSVAVVTGVVFGFAPAWRAARLDPAAALAVV